MVRKKCVEVEHDGAFRQLLSLSAILTASKLDQKELWKLV